MNFQTFDLVYLEKLRRGDRETEGHFVQYFTELMVLKLRSRGRRRDEIDEVVQETFARTLKLIRSPGGVRQAERLGPLVNSICNNVLREGYRTQGRAEPLSEEAAAMLVEPRADALAAAIDEDTKALVAQVLAGLSERDRDLLRALLLEESDKDNVCAHMGVSRGHLRVLLHRAKHQFRDLYATMTAAPNAAPGVGDAEQTRRRL